MLANFRLFQRGDIFYLQLPAGSARPAQTPGMFVLRAQVSLQDVSDQLVRIGLAGGCAPRLLGERLAPAGQRRRREPWRTTSPSSVSRAGSQVRADRPRRSDAAPLATAGRQSATPVKRRSWALLDLRAGFPPCTRRPSSLRTTNGQHAADRRGQLPQGLLHRPGNRGPDAISGQAKAPHVPRPRGHGSSAGPGDELFSAATASGQGTGKIVDARPAPEGGYDLLAVIEIETAERGDLHLNDGNGPSWNCVTYPTRSKQTSERIARPRGKVSMR